ncbi:telomeric repeat binding factor a [Symphorus nematophorus]
MAAETVNSHETESVANRWIVDYYLFLALEFFQKDQYEDFSGICDVINSIMVRPFESPDSMPTKFRVVQFLSRINKGECLDVSFESDLSLSPLESALTLLENIHQECSIPQQDFETVCTSLKEMMVAIFIKNNKFDKAKQMLSKHFPKQTVGKKAVFMRLISQKSKKHEVIEQIDFQRFRKEMLTFCQRLCSFNVPFLHKAAKQLIDKRLAESDDKAAGPDEQDEPGPSSSPQINIVQFVPCKYTVIQCTRLEAAYKVLAAASDEKTFAQVYEEVEKEEQAENVDLSLCLSPTPTKSASGDFEPDGLFQRDSGSPMEASPADQTPQTDAAPQTQAGSLSEMPTVPGNRQLYTVAQLVVEPDSQASSQCTAASQEPEVEIRSEERLQSPAISSKKDPQNPVTDNEVTTLTRKSPRQATKVCSRNSSKSKQLSSDSEEDLQHKTPVRKRRKRPASDPLSKDPGDICIADASLDSSPEIHPVPSASSTPQKASAQEKGASTSKWKQMYNNAKESKDTWSDEESYFSSRKTSSSHNASTMSNSGQRKRMWTESETQKLKEGVKRFGEGNWSKIKAYYSFKDRTNVNLKDRWRTMKKLSMV